MQALVHTRDGSGCRAGLVVLDAARRAYWLTCGHPFARDEPFARQAIGETQDGHGRRVRYARLRAGVMTHEVDAALIEIPGAYSPGAPPSAAAGLLLNGQPLRVVATNAQVRLANYGFTGMTLAEGARCHRGESGSLVTTRRGRPAALVLGMWEQRVVLEPIAPVLAWFARHGIAGLRPAALAQ